MDESEKIPTGPHTDPDLEALVTELRASLTSTQTLLQTQATRLARASELETELAQLKDQFAFVSAAKEAVSAQLQEEIKRREVAEENVNLLRSQVEQARRGVMQLQKQDMDRRRMSQQIMGGGLVTIDDESVGSPSLVGNTGGLAVPADEIRANKRSSVLFRASHRRVSSQSEPGDMPSSTIATHSLSPSQPQGITVLAGGLRELRLGSGLGSPITTSPRENLPAVFDDAASVNSAVTGTGSTMAPPAAGSESINELHASKDELNTLRNELVHVHAKLAESEEARIASETCLKALREFLANAEQNGRAEGGVDGAGRAGGVGTTPMAIDLSDDASPFAGLTSIPGLRLPPLPTDKDADTEYEPEGRTSPRTAGKQRAAWTGFRLWNTRPTSLAAPNPTSPAPSTAVEPPTPHSPPAQSIAASSDRPESYQDGDSNRSSLPLTDEQLNHLPPPTSATPLAAFVSSWTKTVSPGNPNQSSSSTSTATPAASALTSPSSLVPPGTSRKISNFFSRARGLSQDKEKDVSPDLVRSNSSTAASLLQPSPSLESDDPIASAAMYEILHNPELAGIKLPPKPSDDFIPSPITANYDHVPEQPPVPSVVEPPAAQEDEGEMLKHEPLVDVAGKEMQDPERTPVVGHSFRAVEVSAPVDEAENAIQGEAEREAEHENESTKEEVVIEDLEAKEGKTEKVPKANEEEVAEEAIKDDEKTA